jgi:uncharacterized protein (TIGR02569 family)
MPPVAVLPSRSILSAFGAHGEPDALEGGEGLAFRAGSVVLKRVHDVAEAEWTQATLARIDQDGFRVPTPIPATTGDWVHDRWSASRFVPDLRPVAPRWNDIVPWGLRFGEAAERARPPNADALDARTHRWAVADRVAWSEADVQLSPEATEVRRLLAELVIPVRVTERHFVHGDLSGNVFLDGFDRPVILDVSPYLRHRRWAAAVVVADAVLWHGADASFARGFAAGTDDRGLLGRALIFRLVAEQLAPDPRHGATLEPYRRVLAEVG